MLQIQKILFQKYLLENENDMITKRLIIICLLLAGHTFFCLQAVQAQIQTQADCLSDEPNSPSCNGIISTDPSLPINQSRPEMKNYFNWMNSAFSVYHPSGAYWGGTNIPFQVTNPYYTADAYLANLNYYNFLFADRVPSNLDFRPEDGWELIHKGNGYDVDETTLLATADNRVGPYFILYNKYTGTLRTFAAFSNIGVNDVMLTIMQYKKTAGLSYSGLFNKYENVIAPLDQPTNVSQIIQGSPATISGQFFSSDFKMNYDPCVCNYNSSIYIDFKVKNEGSIRLDGRLVGTNVPLDGSGNSPLLNGREFLTAVNSQNFSVKGGMLTYNNIDKLVAKYKTSNDLFTELLLASVKSILGGVAKPFEDILDKPATNLLTKSFGGSTILGTKLKDTLKVSLGGIGAATGYLGSLLGSGRKVPNISFIEAEMALSGTVTYTPGLGTGAIWEFVDSYSDEGYNHYLIVKKNQVDENDSRGEIKKD
jgi:hypothetical protein